MTSVPSGSKGKGKVPSDWRIRALATVPTPDDLANLHLPIKAFPEQKDTVPAEYAVNTQFLINDVPWIGYYGQYNNARIAVSNMYGVWFEIRRRGDSWEAHRLARPALDLNDLPLTGINYSSLLASGEPVTHPPTRAATPTIAFAPATTPAMAPAVVQHEPIKYWADDGEPIQSSTTNKPARQRDDDGGDGGEPDDPMEAATLRAARAMGYQRLEGNPPDRFDGNRARTRRFLLQFRQFMLMNDDTSISRNDIKKCTYFLSLIEGPKVEGWTERMYEWLDAAKSNPGILMGRSAWDHVSREFLDAFVDYAESERAQDEMKNLRMKEGKINEYIAAFECLAFRAGVNLDDPSNLRTFARGLPPALVEIVIRQDNPENFPQWRDAAQKQQRNWLKIQSFKASYGAAQPPSRPNQRNNSFGNFYWRRPEQKQGRDGYLQNQQNQRRGSFQPAHPRLPPRNDDAMDTSAVMRKATNDKEKEEYRKTGKCFECGKQGHLARVCPTKKNRQMSYNRIIEAENDETDYDLPDVHFDPEMLATRAMRLSDEDKDAFVRKLRDLGAETGFVDA